MAKFAAAAALCLAALVAVAVGQSELERQRLRDLRCQREVEECPLEACRQVLDRQLTGGMRYGVGPFRWGTGLRMRCCQQLQDVSRECRCAAIRRMMRGYEETMPPLEGGGYGYGYSGESAGEGYGYGEGRSQSRRAQLGEEGYYGGEGAGLRQPLGGRRGCRCGQAGEGYMPFPAGTGRRIGRVRLTKARQYAAGLPMMCRLEPQECSFFDAPY